jgi:hypothetical protein
LEYEAGVRGWSTRLEYEAAGSQQAGSPLPAGTTGVRALMGISGCFGRVKRGAHFFDVGSVAMDCFMELIAGNAELFGPISDVGSHLGVDDFRVVRTFRVVFVESVRLVSLGAIVVLRHYASSLSVLLVDVHGVDEDVQEP